ncbi:MAG TPA: hypothetical protein QF564_07135 [Pirellulaceae bacterium]|nr:hypothetical protein [Pirellulaceae bacterium]
MSVSVQCPTCSKELLAAAELVGKLASCPHCQAQFPITKSATRTVGETPATETATETRYPEPANLYPPGQSPSPSVSETANVASIKGQSLPGTAAGKAAPQSTPPPATRFSSPAAKSARPSPSKPSREARPARFIAADASETRVELGHDGQLPVLQLEEATRIDVDQENARTSNPWLLVAALAVSFGMSAVLLFVETDGAPAERTTKKSARRDVEMYYSRPVPQPQRYRQLLREALQAYNKEDYATERRRYKQVLDLLHAENNDRYSGLTGQVSASEPPNDRHLEELLSTLVDN